jgi:hypothetical protein
MPSDSSPDAALCLATVVVVGLLSYRMRAAVALLQASAAEPVVEQPTSTVTAAPAVDARSPAGAIAEAPSAIRGEIDAPIRYRDLPHRLRAYQVASDTRPAWVDDEFPKRRWLVLRYRCRRGCYLDG